RALGRGLQGLSIRIAKGINRLMRHHGHVFSDRYHARSLRTPTEVRNALNYVLQNHRHHVEPHRPYPAGAWDRRSSAAYFDGWTRALSPPDDEPPPGTAPT